MSFLAEQSADRFQIALSPVQLEQFNLLARELSAWNERINLTAITDPREIEIRHILDSLSVALVVDLNAPLRMVDVGTGAGFPGLPLKIAFPQLHITLLEATGKKVAFLSHVIDTLGLMGIEAVHGRAEEFGHLTGRRAGYDVVLARSVARLPALLEYLLPLARVGGRCVAMKGETAAAEAADSKRALQLLGGRLARIEPVALPSVTDPHYLVLVEKVAHTPAAYPRQPGLPTRKPLL